jgi:hypothetical protein
MNLKRALLLTLTAAALLGLAFGCTFGVTIQGRLDQFVSDLNAADRSELYLNLDPSLGDYDALKDTAYWGNDTTTGWFPLVGVDTPYSLSAVVVDDPGTGTATVTATIDGPDLFGGPWDIVFGLVKVDLDWMIESIILDSDSVVPLPPPT